MDQRNIAKTSKKCCILKAWHYFLKEKHYIISNLLVKRKIMKPLSTAFELGWWKKIENFTISIIAFKKKKEKLWNITI